MPKKYLYLILFVLIIFTGYSFGRRNSPTENEDMKTSDIQKENTLGQPLMNIVELADGDTYNLTAGFIEKKIDGKTHTMLAYNGTIPGPLIKVKKGSEITIHLKNSIDMETTLHSHGIRLENAFDGVPDLTQEPIGVGETFDYTIAFPDEGMYWYHPHIREDYTQELGLYGNYLVVGDDYYWSPVNREIPLVLDDILITENGEIAKLDRDMATHVIMGRFGNVMLVNGEDEYTLEVQKGEVIRFYITNVANARTFNLVIPGAKIKLVGGDSGSYERETWVESVMVSPSERSIIEVLFEEKSYELQHKTPDKTYKLGTIRVLENSVENSYEEKFATLRTNQATIDSIDKVREYFDKPIDKKLTLSIDMEMEGMEQMDHNMDDMMMVDPTITQDADDNDMKKSQMEGMTMQGEHMMEDGTMMNDSMMNEDGMMKKDKGDKKIEWEDDMGMMNTMSNTENTHWKLIDQETGDENMDIDWNFSVGDKVKISIFNDPESVHPMQHPIHFHGQRFLVLSTNEKRHENLVWKDTLLVQNGDTVVILLNVTNPGKWMAHCHIAEHLTSGMMMSFKVE